jgi:uncharacterized protein (TIGR03437 family)
VSAASFEQGPLAPGSLVSAFPLFFSVLSTSTDSATSTDWPTTLGGASVLVKDSTGLSMPAQMSYASPGQLNFRLPAGLAAGAGSVTITAGGYTITSHINIQPVYPNLFMSDAGATAAGSLTPIDGQLYLTLYGSGLGSATSVTATIGGVPATVTYAGPQGTYPGLDQYNILVPESLVGKGKIDVIVTAAGKPSNPVNVALH